MLIAFTLTMPSVNTWNGQWSGQDKLYIRVENIKKEIGLKVLKEDTYYYKWSDGWTACIKVQRVDCKEAAKLRRKSQGFCGYEWMIKSIIHTGRIEIGE